MYLFSAYFFLSNVVFFATCYTVVGMLSWRELCCCIFWKDVMCWRAIVLLGEDMLICCSTWWFVVAYVFLLFLACSGFVYGLMICFSTPWYVLQNVDCVVGMSIYFLAWLMYSWRVRRSGHFVHVLLLSFTAVGRLFIPKHPKKDSRDTHNGSFVSR